MLWCLVWILLMSILIGSHPIHSWPVICFAGHVLVFLCGFCLVLPCALMSWPRPSCYLIIGSFAPPVFPSLPSSFAPYLFSLCLQFCASSLLNIPPVVSWACLALPCQLVFPPRGSFCCFCFILLLKSPSLLQNWVFASSLYHTLTNTFVTVFINLHVSSGPLNNINRSWLLILLLY